MPDVCNQCVDGMLDAHTGLAERLDLGSETAVTAVYKRAGVSQCFPDRCAGTCDQAMAGLVEGLLFDRPGKFFLLRAPALAARHDRTGLRVSAKVV